MPNPLENNLLLYYLSGMGKALSPEGSVGEALGGMTQQHIQSRNYMKMLQSLLSGMPAGSKLTGDRDNIMFKVPTSAAGGTAPEATPQTGLQTTPKIGELPSEQRSAMYAGGMNLLNPSPSLPDVSGADLAGLTPKEISQALQFKMGYEQLGQKRMTDLVDMIYKSAQASKLRTEEGLAGEKLKPSDVRSYEYAVEQGFEGDLEAWKNIATTTHEKDYERAKSEGYEGNFYDWLLEFQKAGATRISLGELGAREEQRWNIKSRKYFTSKDFTADTDKYINETVRRAEWMSSDRPEVSKAGMTAKYIKQKIIGSGGKIKGVKRSGKILIWTVEWPDGKTSEVKYAF